MLSRSTTNFYGCLSSFRRGFSLKQYSLSKKFQLARIVIKMPFLGLL